MTEERVLVAWKQGVSALGHDGKSIWIHSRQPPPVEAEPPAELTVRTTDQLFGEIGRQLQGADVLRLVDEEWLVVDDYRHHVERVLAAFRGRGGRVESPGPVREATQ